MFMEEKQNSQTSLDFNQNIFKPSSREEIVEVVKNCYRKNIPLEINGLKSKNKIGRNFQSEKTIDLSEYKGIIDYKPEELYIKVKAGTPLREIIEENTKLGKDNIWIYLLDLKPNQMIEYGEILPKSGGEKKWFKNLPTKLKIRLNKIDN